MPPITASIDVDRPAEEVFAYATDPSRFSEWQKGVVSGQMETTGAPSLGTAVSRPGALAWRIDRSPLSSSASIRRTTGACVEWTANSGHCRRQGRSSLRHSRAADDHPRF